MLEAGDALKIADNLEDDGTHWGNELISSEVMDIVLTTPWATSWIPATSRWSESGGVLNVRDSAPTSRHTAVSEQTAQHKLSQRCCSHLEQSKADFPNIGSLVTIGAGSLYQ